MTSWSYALSRMRIFCPAIWASSSISSCRCLNWTLTSKRRDGRGSTAPGRRGGSLLQNLGDPAGADGAAAFPDRELQAVFHGDGLNEADRHVGPVTRHHHLRALRQRDHAGHVGGTEVELRAIVVEERRVTAALLLGQDVDLAALNVLALDPAEQQPHVVARLALVEELAEHLHAGDGGRRRLLLDADDVDDLAGVDHAAPDPAGHHGAAA